MIISTIKKGQFIKIENDDRMDCFYGLEEETEKMEALKNIQSEMSDYQSFKVNCDFERWTKFKEKEWWYLGNVMIYENTLATDTNRILIDGKGNYECILWMSANIKSES